MHGVPGSGKTYLLNELRQHLDKQDLDSKPFIFYEGSDVIAEVVPGSLNAFKNLEDWEKGINPGLAIDKIRKNCTESGHVGVVAGHFMFWPKENEAGNIVCTANDLSAYTHIIYYDVDAKTVLQRRQNDKERKRPAVPIEHLRKWQEAEKIKLRRLCRNHGLLFSVVTSGSSPTNKVAMLLHDFAQHNEEHNLDKAKLKLEKSLSNVDKLETVLVIDADKTLVAEDTGKIFWKRIRSSLLPKGEDPLKTLFESPLKYTYTAFRQATLLYEAVADDQQFDILGQEVASMITIRPEFVSLLQLVAKQAHMRAIIVTCGLCRVFEKVLENEGLSDIVKVIGGGRIVDDFVVTDEVKAALVTHLQSHHHQYVWAFRDSPLDLEMLSRADEAIVVVGDEQTRSNSMEKALEGAIDKEGLWARQAVFPITASPRLNVEKLPLIQLMEPEFLDSLLHRRPDPGIEVLDATNKNAAKLLMTPTRDANIAGPALREAHRRVGWYLATEFLADVIGVEGYSIRHVQDRLTTGHRLLYEKQTLIIALMRGGEPMALGVNDAFPLAGFKHANAPDDIKIKLLKDQRTVVLVDSVVNSGKTVVQFVQHIRKLDVTVRIVVIAGVIQAQCVLKGGDLAKGLFTHDDDTRVSIITLRFSDNKYSGERGTDTGNRLFNTTQLS